MQKWIDFQDQSSLMYGPLKGEKESANPRQSTRMAPEIRVEWRRWVESTECHQDF